MRAYEASKMSRALAFCAAVLGPHRNTARQILRNKLSSRAIGGEVTDSASCTTSAHGQHDGWDILRSWQSDLLQSVLRKYGGVSMASIGATAHGCVRAKTFGQKIIARINSWRAPVEKRIARIVEDDAVILSGSFAVSPQGRTFLTVGPVALEYCCLQPNAPVVPAPDLSAWRLASPAPQLKHFMSPLNAALSRVVDEVLMTLRAAYLLILFSPVLLLANWCLVHGHARREWAQLLRWTLERAGPAFIKVGQWVASRPDLLPPDLCDELESLHSNVPVHSFRHTKKAVEDAFGCSIDAIFEEFGEEPLASGSIAQVHRAILSERGATGTKLQPGTEVAVKVRHPGVDGVVARDFELMMRAARICAQLPVLRDFRIEEGVRQFGGPLQEQLDLSVEAAHLEQFGYNFRMAPHISFPQPVYPLVTPDVLVESFEAGRPISTFVKTPGEPHNRQIAHLGLHLYLQMLLCDNYVHADLHPGNILIRLPQKGTLWGDLCGAMGMATRANLVLLDTGMIAVLDRADQRALVSLFKALARQHGSDVGHAVLKLAEGGSLRGDKEAEARFIRDMSWIFDHHSGEYISRHTGEVMMQMMSVVRKHRVLLKSEVSTVLVTSLVLDGWSSKLDPSLRVLEGVRELFPMHWEERIPRTTDQLVADGAAASDF